MVRSLALDLSKNSRTWLASGGISAFWVAFLTQGNWVHTNPVMLLFQLPATWPFFVFDIDARSGWKLYVANAWLYGSLWVFYSALTRAALAVPGWLKGPTTRA